MPLHSVPLQSVPIQSISELSEAAQRAIDPNAPMTDIVIQIGRCSVSRENLRRLLNGQKDVKQMYLDDELINFYFARLMDRANTNPSLPKLYCFVTHLLESANPNTWARTVNLFKMELILFPVLINKTHWVLVAVSPAK